MKGKSLKQIIILFLFIFCIASSSFAKSVSVTTKGNSTIQSFNQAKKALEREVHTEDFMRVTIYCEAPYKQSKDVILPSDFNTEKYTKRSKRIEWEHVVPAENFGRTFSEWRDGHELCVDKKGKYFKGRKCAEKVNTEYRYMQADMYNLYPAIGSVNAMRSNYNFVPMSASDTFGSGCEGMIIQDRKVSPPDKSRGQIARAYLYMENTYKTYKMSDSQRKLMQAWNKQYPVTKNECIRTKRIEAIQENENLLVKELCKANGYW